MASPPPCPPPQAGEGSEEIQRIQHSPPLAGESWRGGYAGAMSLAPALDHAFADLHGCALLDIDFPGRIIHITGPEEAVYRCGLELEEVLGMAASSRDFGNRCLQWDIQKTASIQQYG